MIKNALTIFHTSKASEIIFERVKEIRISIGIANSKEMAAAKNPRAFSILNKMKTSHRYTIPIKVILIPIGRNKRLSPINLSSIYRKAYDNSSAIPVSFKQLNVNGNFFDSMCLSMKCLVVFINKICDYCI